MPAKAGIHDFPRHEREYRAASQPPSSAFTAGQTKTGPRRLSRFGTNRITTTSDPTSKPAMTTTSRAATIKKTIIQPSTIPGGPYRLRRS